MFEIVARLGHDNKSRVIVTVRAAGQAIEIALYPEEATELCRRLLKSADVAYRLTHYMDKLPPKGVVDPRPGPIETLGDA